MVKYMLDHWSLGPLDFLDKKIIVLWFPEQRGRKQDLWDQQVKKIKGGVPVRCMALMMLVSLIDDCLSNRIIFHT